MKRLIPVAFATLMLSGCGSPAQDQAAAPAGRPPAAGPRTDFVNQGIAYLKDADVAEAIGSFDEAVRQNPLDPQPYILLGETYMHMQDYTRAVDSFSAAARVAPQRGDVYYLLAMNQGLLGNTEEARESAQRSVEIFQMQKDEANFKKSVALLQGLMNSDEPVQQ